MGYYNARYWSLPPQAPGLGTLTIGIYTLDDSGFLCCPAGYGYYYLNENDYHYHLPGFAGLLRMVLIKRASVTVLYKCTVNPTIQNYVQSETSYLSLI